MTDDKFSGSVPYIYHRYLVPLIFESYADDLSERLNVNPGAMVLETASGTGVLTERLLKVLPRDVQLVVTDLSSAMLEIAQANLPEAKNLSYQEADGIDLPFEDDSFDALVCQFGVMFFPDIEQSYREARRVLKAGGEFLFNVWDTLDANVLPRTVHEVSLSLNDQNPPNFLQTPFGYNDVELITAQLEKAGFTEVTATVLTHDCTASSVRDVAIAFGAGTPLALQLEERGLSDTAIDRFASVLKERFGSGPVSAPMQAIVFEAR